MFAAASAELAVVLAVEAVDDAVSAVLVAVLINPDKSFLTASAAPAVSLVAGSKLPSFQTLFSPLPSSTSKAPFLVFLISQLAQFPSKNPY